MIEQIFWMAPNAPDGGIGAYLFIAVSIISACGAGIIKLRRAPSSRFMRGLLAAIAMLTLLWMGWNVFVAVSFKSY